MLKVGLCAKGLLFMLVSYLEWEQNCDSSVYKDFKWLLNGQGFDYDHHNAKAWGYYF